MDEHGSYRDKVMDHYTKPPNRRWFEGADLAAHGSNPVCGDDLTIQAIVEGDVIKEIAFSGRGCAISQAASILTELAKGKSLEWVAESSEEDIFTQLGLGEHRKARFSCELLGIRALKTGVSRYRGS